MAQQNPAQPFTPYNGTNGGNPTAYTGQIGQPVRMYGLPNFGTYTGSTNGNAAYNPACDRNSPYFNPNNCR